MMNRPTTILLLFLITALNAGAEEFRHIGDFLVRSRLKVVEDQPVPVAIKPLRLSVYTDGVKVRVSTAANIDQSTEYTIYRSDGIGRQRSHGGALEVVPGVQAWTESAGVFRQLRLTLDTLTITTFPGVSNQTIVTHAVVAAPKAVVAEPAADNAGLTR